MAKLVRSVVGTPNPPRSSRDVEYRSTGSAPKLQSFGATDTSKHPASPSRICLQLTFFVWGELSLLLFSCPPCVHGVHLCYVRVSTLKGPSEPLTGPRFVNEHSDRYFDLAVDRNRDDEPNRPPAWASVLCSIFGAWTTRPLPSGRVRVVYSAGKKPVETSATLLG